MKRIFCMIALMGLCACDRPQYDVRLDCSDGAGGHIQVDARVYKSNADLQITRLYKDLSIVTQSDSPYRGDHSWLYNQIPQIDDTITLRLDATESGTEYAFENKIKMDVGHDRLTGGATFILWYAPDTPATAHAAELKDGEYLFGTTCTPIIDPQPQPTHNIPAAQRGEIKNCIAYISAQLTYDSTPTVRRIRVFDENTGRQMYINQDAFDQIFGDIDPTFFHFYSDKWSNANKFLDDVMHSCEVAARLREYIAAHIDTDYIRAPENVVPVALGEEIGITCDGQDIIFRGQ